MEKRFIPLILILAILTLFGTAGAGAITGLNDKYVSGETITVVITNSDESAILATLEANEFDFNKENVNFIRSYGATSKEKDGRKTWTLNIDTTGVPLGTYNLILKGDTKILAADTVKIVSEKTKSTEPVIPQDTSIEHADEDTNPVTPASPGFSLIPLLGIALIPYLWKKKN